MTALITEADYDTIRKAIDLTVDENMLPGDVIALPIYEASAIRQVVDRHPTAESETGNNLKRVMNAAALFCAALIAPAMTGKMVNSLSTSTRDLNFSRPPYNGEKRAAELRGLAEAEIAEVLEPADETHARPTMFAVAAGLRGR